MVGPVVVSDDVLSNKVFNVRGSGSVANEPSNPVANIAESYSAPFKLAPAGVVEQRHAIE